MGGSKNGEEHSQPASVGGLYEFNSRLAEFALDFPAHGALGVRWEHGLLQA